jgi:hypothetical protein
MPDKQLPNNLTGTCEAICHRADRQGLDSLTRPERVVALTSWGQALVENGGFRYFYDGAHNSDLVAMAYVDLGLVEVASLWLASRELFPPDLLTEEALEARRMWMDKKGVELETKLKELSESAWDAAGDIEEALSGFVKEHHAEILTLP